MHDLKAPVALDDAAKAHAADLATQDAYGVHYLRYWVDEGDGKIFCLVDAPDEETAKTVHAPRTDWSPTDLITDDHRVTGGADGPSQLIGAPRDPCRWHLPQPCRLLEGGRLTRPNAETAVPGYGERLLSSAGQIGPASVGGRAIQGSNSIEGFTSRSRTRSRRRGRGDRGGAGRPPGRAGISAGDDP
jgi:hypothetical protein